MTVSTPLLFPDYWLNPAGEPFSPLACTPKKD